MHAKLTQKLLDQIGTKKSARCALCKFFLVEKLFHRLNKKNPLIFYVKIYPKQKIKHIPLITTYQKNSTNFFQNYPTLKNKLQMHRF
jgi:hypothetical protein